VSRVTVVPTHALELVEAAPRAARGRAAHRSTPCHHLRQHPPLDALTQHLVTSALGEASSPMNSSPSCARRMPMPDLPTRNGSGAGLCRSRRFEPGRVSRVPPVVADEDGVLRVPNRAIAHRHRMNIGTIVSDARSTSN